MSIPLEPMLGTSRGSYTINEEPAERREMAATDVEGGDEIKETGAQDRMERFRGCVSRSCCSCVERMPAICLIVGICAIVALLLALIPAVFVLTNAVSGESQAQVSSGFEIPAIRAGFTKPDNDDDAKETEDLPGLTHGIPMSALHPPNVSMCEGFGFSCIDQPWIVIATARRCDGVPDCPDKSDEANCRECQSAASCKTKEGSKHLICLATHHLCDEISHCPDGSDEDSFCSTSAKCKETQLQCKGKHGAHICLPEAARCDGIEDCHDGDDESECNTCSRGAKMCEPTGQCISARLVCDGEIQCSDGSDEADCNCRSCSGSSRAVCDDGTCIADWMVCDGISDCADGMDEVDCPGRCDIEEDAPKQEDLILCSDGHKYLQSEACSGELKQCAGFCEACSAEAFACPRPDNKNEEAVECIPRRQLCDGVAHCPGAEDEINCECGSGDGSGEEPEDEESGFFQCKTNDKCIPSTQHCDGIRDCHDGSDEQNCIQCSPDAFRCEVDQSCHPSSARCDGIAQCPDFADEIGCSCHECIGLHSSTYMCGNGSRCLPRDKVCTPYSTCPNATFEDKAYCAALSLRE